MSSRHTVLLHTDLGFSGETERALAVARTLLSRGERVTLVSRDGSRRRPFEDLGVPIRRTEIPLDPRRGPFAAWRLRRLLIELAPDLVHVTSERLAPLAATLARTLLAPYVLEVHRANRGRIPRYAPRLRGVVISASTLAAEIVNQGQVPRELLRVIPHSPRLPDALSDPARPAPFEHPDPIRIGCSGLLDERHGTETFLAAAKRLGRLERPLLFVILGEGPTEGALRRRLRKGELDGRAVLAVPGGAEAATTLASLDVHVSCRLDGPDWLAHMALALGRPSIVAAVGESFDLIEDRVSGVLVERGSAEELADQIELLVSNPEAAREMGRRAAGRMRELHPPEAFDEGLVELHATALGA